MNFFKLLLPFIIFLSIIISGCTSADGYSYSHVHEKLRGEWTIEKVKFENNDRLFESDVTGTYEGITFNFKPNNELSIFDPKIDIEYIGVWYLDENYTWDEDKQKEEKSYSLYTYAYNPNDTTQVRTMTWTDLRVNNRTLFGREKRYMPNNKTLKYTYKLKK